VMSRRYRVKSIHL